MNGNVPTRPEWRTSARLLKLGESIDFDFVCPNEDAPCELDVFPRYLEQADPGDEYVAGGGLDWLDALRLERIHLDFTDGVAHTTYRPDLPGNYIARWRCGDELFYRYFAAIEDDYVVMRYSGYHELTMEPTFHSAGIAIDLPLPVDNLRLGDHQFEQFLRSHRYHGDTIVPQLPDTPDLTHEERLEAYREPLERARDLIPDPNDARAARIEMWHEEDPGYVPALTELGVESHFGLQMANGGPFLGMPEFPYFASQHDVRKPNQGDGGDLVVHQWDFCGGWHFLGPLSWHYSIGWNDWPRVEAVLDRGVMEAANLAENSRHPAFICPLYDGNIHGADDMRDFIERYQRYIAFEVPKRYKAVFTRCIDLADYYKRHFRVTPRTVFSSIAKDISYVMHWGNVWAGRHELLARERLPWLTRISTVMGLRKTSHGAKDPLSYEYLVVEDQRRSIRFERESANPIWWFDYTHQEEELTAKGSTISHVETPDVDVVCVGDAPFPPEQLVTYDSLARPKWRDEDGRLTTTLRMITTAEFPNYAIIVWGLPDAFTGDASDVETNAREFVLAKNTDGERHLVLIFDLKPNLEINVVLGRSS